MIIGKISFPIYGTFILLSLMANTIFNYIYLKSKKVDKKSIFLSIFMVLSFCLICSKTMSIITVNSNLNLLTAGLSSYGGAIGIIIGSYLFSKMINSFTILKSNILVLPLMYSISKLGCFFVGCCYGIPYHGMLSVTYTQGLNISLVPIQLLESIVFFIIFCVCFMLEKKEYVLEFIVILSAIAKFLLEYLRYENIGKTICTNQLISLLLIIITIILLVVKRKKVKQIV